jgi:amidase
MPPAELWQWDAVELARAIRTRRISSREAVQANLDRLTAVNPKLNAVTVVLAEQALRDADAADAAAKRGDAPGPLHGVPVTIKENVDQAGQATANGVPAFKDLLAADDSPPVANWRKAGAVIIGRTNAPAFSLRWDTDNALRGRTYNPWAKDRTPGGSSGGASAALAAGIGALAHGNDYGGSIRYPAYCCGLAGIRPSFGRVPAYNATAAAERPPTLQLMSVQGPLARRVRDLRLGLAAMAARDPRDPWWTPAPLEGPPLQKPIRVALVTAAPGLHVDPAVADAVRKAGAALADAGYAVEETSPPSIEAASQLWARLAFTDARETAWPLIDKYGDAGVKRALTLSFAVTPTLSLAEYIAGLAERAKHLRDWMLFLERYSLVLGPNSGEPPYAIGFDLKSEDGTRHLLRSHALMVAVNLLGLPSVAVPVGAMPAAGAPAGLPLGVQVIASRYREDLALDAAEIIEARHGLATPIDAQW